MGTLPTTLPEQSTEQHSSHLRGQEPQAAIGPSEHVSERHVEGTCNLIVAKDETGISYPTFYAGMIKFSIDNWKCLTTDHTILAAVQGYKIEFILKPTQFHVPRPIRCSLVEAI